LTDPPNPERQDPLTASDLAEGEQYAGPHDPDPAEQFAGDPVPDPWDDESDEEGADGQLDPGAVPRQPAQ
jgi:hypothetical protein